MRSLREPVAWALLGFSVALPVSIASLNIAAGILTVLVLLADRMRGDVPWDGALQAFGYALLAYFGAAALTSAFGVEPSVSFKALNKDFHKLWILWLLLAAMRFAGTRGCALWFGAGLLAVSLVGVYQGLFIRQPGAAYWTRAHGFVHPVTFGEQLGLGLLGAMAFLARREEARHEGLSRPILWGFLAVGGLAFVLNQTRGAFLGAAAGGLALALANKSARRWALPALACCAAFALAWELLPTGRSLAATLRDGLSPSSNQHLARFAFWKIAWRMFLDYPIFGVGPGNYKTVFTAYFQGSIAEQSVWGSAHNLYLHQLAERGALGLAALLAALGAMTARAVQRARLAPDALNLWALGAAVAFLVMNLTEVAFQNEQVASMILFIWALAEAHHRRKEKAA